MDANINRACEGLRVAEEIARFVLQDGRLLEGLREIRHTVSSLGQGFSGLSLLSSRDVKNDVGRSIKVGNLVREDPLGVARANLRRTEEALRTLEEFSRLKDHKQSVEFENLRFAVYDIEKEILKRLSIIHYQSSIRGLHAIIDLGLFKENYLGIARGAIEGGAGLIQLRAKGVCDRKFFEVGRALRQITRENNLPFIVNDRLDLALALEVDGVHLGQEDLPVGVARSILGMGKIIGRTSHSLDEAINAEREGADYIGLGPIFPTLTKPDLLPVGISLLREVKERVRLPVIAIGGIGEGNIQEVIEAGADGIACASCLARVEDVRKMSQDLSDHFRVYNEPDD